MGMRRGLVHPRGTWLGCRFRALKLWMVIRHFGHEGLAARIRRHIELAQDLVQRIDADPDIEALAPAPFSTVCFRFRPSELKALSGDARPRQACDEYLLINVPARLESPL
jgi:aromatic-L-amino-acid decarboxylase